MKAKNNNISQALRKFPLAALVLGLAVALDALTKLFSFIGSFLFPSVAIIYGGMRDILLDVGGWLCILASVALVVFLLLKKKGVIFLVPICAFILANGVDYLCKLFGSLVGIFDLGINAAPNIFGTVLYLLSDLTSFIFSCAVWIIIALLILANNVEKLAFFKKAEKILWIVAAALIALQLLGGVIDLFGALIDTFRVLLGGFNVTELFYGLPKSYLGAFCAIVYPLAYFLVLCEFSYPLATKKRIDEMVIETVETAKAGETDVSDESIEKADTKGNENE